MKSSVAREYAMEVMKRCEEDVFDADVLAGRQLRAAQEAATVVDLEETGGRVGDDNDDNEVEEAQDTGDERDGDDGGDEAEKKEEAEEEEGDGEEGGEVDIKEHLDKVAEEIEGHEILRKKN